MERARVQDEKGNIWTRRGTDIHAAFRELLLGQVPTYDSKVVEPARELVREVRTVVQVASSIFPIGAWHGEGSLLDAVGEEWMLTTETRLWATTPAGNRFSGQYDLALTNETRGLAVILDAKTGWANVEPAPSNLQLRTLLSLAHHAFGCTDALVAILQPAVAAPSQARYQPEDIEPALASIDAIVDGAYAGGALNPSLGACKYCPAKLHCDQLTLIHLMHSLRHIPADHAKALEQCELADLVSAEVRAEAKRQLAYDPASVPGWELRVSHRRAVPNTQAAYDALVNERGMSAQQFHACCKLGIGKAESTLASLLNLKVPEAKRALAAKLGDQLILTASEPSLVPINAAETDATPTTSD